MKIEDIKQKQKQKKNVNINLKITPEVSKWLKENKISPTRLWDTAVEELRKQEKN